MVFRLVGEGLTYKVYMADVRIWNGMEWWFNNPTIWVRRYNIQRNPHFLPGGPPEMQRQNREFLHWWFEERFGVAWRMDWCRNPKFTHYNPSLQMLEFFY